MLAAVHLTVLASLFAVTLCAESTTSAPLPLLTSEPTSTAGHLTSSTVVILSTEKITTNAQQHETTTAHSAVPASSSTPPSTSPQTSIRTEETHASQTPGTTADNQTSSETVSHRTTLSPASQTTNVTGVMINTTTTASPQQWGKGDWAANPGLVAVLVIFCITLILVLVVALVKCTQSPRSNFERLEDVPMGNVNEKSPFAQHLK